MEDSTEKLAELDTTINLLQTRNKEIETTLKAQQDMGNGSGELTPDSLNSIISIPDPFSEKIVHIVSKYNALEDCMAAVKKGFEKDVVSLPDFLKQVRMLAAKQYKQRSKMQRIQNALNAGQKEQVFSGY